MTGITGRADAEDEPRVMSHWGEVWDSEADRGKAAKANDVAKVEGEGHYMAAQAGVAAE